MAESLIKTGWSDALGSYLDGSDGGTCNHQYINLSSKTYYGVFGLNRQELALMLYRAAGSPKTDSDALRDYRDGESVSDWAKSAMAWAVEQGILTGSGGKLLPRTGTTRAQAVTLLARYAETL